MDPERVWTKAGARPGDHLVLSKPVGSGIVLAGGSDAAKAAAISVMRTLNRGAAERLSALRRGPAAVTDVTGFGLAGHAWELAERSGVSVRLDARAIPLYDGALEAAGSGVRTGGDSRNRAYLGDALVSRVSPAAEALAVDPQTSGGLLASVDPADAAALVAEGWWRVGEVGDGTPRVELVE